MADTILISRPFVGKRVRTPPKKESIPLPHGERVLWQDFQPPFNLLRVFKRTLRIGRGIIALLLVALIMSFALTVLFPSVEIGIFIVSLFFPSFVILVWRLERYVKATESFAELRARYSFADQMKYQEYFIITNNKVLIKSHDNFAQTSSEFMRDVTLYDGDVFSGILASLTSIRVREGQSNKTRVRLMFEKPEAAMPDRMYFSNNYWTSTTPQEAVYFVPDLARSIGSFLYYSSMFATKHTCIVTLKSANVRELCQVLQELAPQAKVRISKKIRKKKSRIY